MYRVLTYSILFICLFLSGFCITEYVLMCQSSLWKSNLRYEAVISTMALQSLHTGLYHGNIIAWEAKGIKYRQILDLSPSEDFFGYLILASNIACFGYIIEKKEIHHVILYLTIFFATIIGYSYNSEVWRIIYFISTEVTMVNVFLGDQMCSQVPALRKVVYIFCYYCTGSYKKHDYGFYKTNTVYKYLSFAISCIPFLYRGFQCGRKYYDERQTSYIQAINFFKYFCAMWEAIFRVAYENDKNDKTEKTDVNVLLYCLVVSSVIATFYQFFWDIIEDWDLLQLYWDQILQFKPQFGWLTRELLLPKFYYYVAVGVNLVLRFGWALQFILSRFKLNDESVTFIVSLFEVFRRGMWNFFRLENEEAKERTRRNGQNEGEMA